VGTHKLTESPVTVLHVVAPARVGGLESVVQGLVLGSQGSAIHARVAAVVSERDHPFLRPFRDAGVDVISIIAQGRAYRTERAGVAQACRDVRAAVVHTHGYRADVLDAPVARKLGIPVVTTVHGFTGGNWKNRCYEWLQVRAFRRFDAVVAVSDRLAETLVQRGVPRDRVRMIHNGWRPATAAVARDAACERLGEVDGTPRIGWVGRLSAEKGADVFVESLARLGDRAWIACVLGEGPDRAGLMRRAEELGIAERIHWHGLVADAGSLFRAFDVFVISSRTEGMPIVLFEAMANEVPVVTTSVGGIPEAVSSAEAELVAPDNPAALAAGIANVLDQAGPAAARARNAAHRLRDEFGSALWLRRYEAMYRSVIEEART